MNRSELKTRCAYGQTELQTRDLTESGGDNYVIEGYFAVFNSPYEICDGGTEIMAPGAFSTAKDRDIRCLADHDSRIVLGRTKAGTFEIREDEHGLWGRLLINPKDQDAVNLYERVKRGDISGCSIGFNILKEDTDIRDEHVTWTIREVELWECSIVTFPAYAETGVEARSDEIKNIKDKELDAWKLKTISRIKGDNQ